MAVRRSSREHLLGVLERLAAAEDRAFAAEFLAPMVRCGTVRVRIDGVVCRLKVRPTRFEGWGVFRSTSAAEARLIRPAMLQERRNYLDLLPLLRMIVCRRDGDDWVAIPAQRSDARFGIEGLVPLRLIDEAEPFAAVLTRFDGAQCWYDGPDPRHDPGTSAYLRESLAGMVEPDRLSRKGLTAGERAAYAMCYIPRLEAEIEARRDRTEERLRGALAHAGAVLREYQERGDVYRVAYEVDGRRHLSVVARDDLSVQVAGICLSGRDRHFDLQSLVGVMREAEDYGAAVRIGDDSLPEDVYWNVHPPGRP
jgi:hypothetical protein